MSAAPVRITFACETHMADALGYIRAWADEITVWSQLVAKRRSAMHAEYRRRSLARQRRRRG